jgi:hypothetical protein
MTPLIDFVSQKITTFGIGSDMHQEITTILRFIKDGGQEFTPYFGFVENTQREQIGMIFGSFEKIMPRVEVSDYHLIFDLNGVLVATGEGRTRSHLVFLRLGLKEFLFACVKKFMVYILSLAMKRNFSRRVDIIIETTFILLLTSRILD